VGWTVQPQRAARAAAEASRAVGLPEILMPEMLPSVTAAERRGMVRG
jgi:hypothetical protein